MPKKIKNCSKTHLTSIPLPDYEDSYTVISHSSIIDMSIAELKTAGFSVKEEEYRATADGKIAQGVYKLDYNSDPELSMMFAWTNSYNKQVRFRCGIGAHINLTSTTMVCGDMGNWSRKHTGTADEETAKTIKEQIADAQMYYNQLVADKESMKNIIMNKRRQAQMLGILFAEYQILTTEQASMIRQQMDKPLFVFDDSNSLWAFYNYVTLALQHSHPKTWMEDQRILHHFISTINNFTQVPTPVVTIKKDLNLTLENNYGQPENQLNILSEIEKIEIVETEEEVIEDLIDEIIQYTDPVGNTFEAPVVLPCAAHDNEPEEVIESVTEVNLDIIDESVITVEEVDFEMDFLSVDEEDDDSSFIF